jgi:hypothetical protein
MSQNEITRYLNQASDSINLLYGYLDLLTFTANACNGYEPKQVDRVLLMIDTYRSNADGIYDDLEGLIRVLKRELKPKKQPTEDLQPHKE